MGSEISQNLSDVSNLHNFEEVLVLIIVAGCRYLLGEPVHVELAPLQFLDNFVLVHDVPVFFCIFLEIDRESWVNNGSCQLFCGQALETFLQELVNDVLVGVRLRLDLL